MRAVFLDYDSLSPNDLDIHPLYRALPESNWSFYGHSPANTIQDRLLGNNIVVVNKTPLGRQNFISNPQLKLIIVAATGYNNIDLVAAKEFDIAVINSHNYATHSVIQHTIGLMLTFFSKQNRYIEMVRQGAWQKQNHFSLISLCIEEVAGKTLGIIGFGTLGKGVAKVASALGMKILVAQSLIDRNTSNLTSLSILNSSDLLTEYGFKVSLEKLFTNADVISLHCQLSAYSKYIINAKTLNMMKKDALIINTSRGDLIKESDLVSALLSKKIGGACLDVLSTEPPPKDHPLLSLQLPNLIITPHNAWGSKQSRQNLVDVIASHLRRFLDDPVSFRGL